MLKDPNDEALTPYELLALSPNCSAAEVQKALPRFMRDRKNLSRIGQAQEAVRKLQNSKARALIDIWLYHLDTTQIDAEPGSGQEPNLDEFKKIPVFSPDELYCDLNSASMRAEFREITVTPVKFSDVAAIDGLDDIRLLPQFDR